MASLITLSRIPELFDEIFGYLERGDLYSLLLTCWAFHPITYNRLWETIHLYNFDPPQTDWLSMTLPGVTGAVSSSLPYPQPTLPVLPPRIPRKSTCYGLANIINTLGPQNTGLSLTKKLVFDDKSFCSGNALIQSGLMGSIQTLLMNGTLNLSCVELNFHIAVSNEADKEAICSFLTHLKEYSKSKRPEEFSIVLVSTLSIMMAQLIDVEKITNLQLDIDWTYSEGFVPSPDNLFISEEEYDKGIFEGSLGGRPTAYVYSLSSRRMQCDVYYKKVLIERLTSLLLRTTNLISLTLRASGFHSGLKNPRQTDLNLPEPLQDLQAAIHSLSKLRELNFNGTFCHPSCFIAPPDTVRAVSYVGYFSNLWFQSFKGCRFPNVKSLNIRVTRDIQDDFIIRPLGDVSISGLTNFDFFDEIAAAPPDFMHCILRGNPNLDRASRQRATKAISSRLQLTAQERLETAYINSLDYLKEAEDHNPYLRSSLPELPAGYPSINEKGVIDLGNQCLKMLPTAIDNIEGWYDAKSSASEHAFLCEKKINSLLARFKTMLTLEYAQELLDRGDTTERPEDVANTSKRCLQRMLDNFDDHAWWEAARAQASNATVMSRYRVTDHINSFIAKESTDYILGLVDSGELDNIDMELASEKFIQDCAQKLSLTELTETQSPSESYTQALASGYHQAYIFQTALGEALTLENMLSRNT